MKFSEQLIEEIRPIWRANHAHPFVQGIGHGTLEPEKFRRIIHKKLTLKIIQD